MFIFWGSEIWRIWDMVRGNLRNCAMMLGVQKSHFFYGPAHSVKHKMRNKLKTLSQCPDGYEYFQRIVFQKCLDRVGLNYHSVAHRVNSVVLSSTG